MSRRESAQRRYDRRSGSYWDLWRSVNTDIGTDASRLTALWTKAHATAETIQRFSLHPLEVDGNACVDELA